MCGVGYAVKVVLCYVQKYFWVFSISSNEGVCSVCRFCPPALQSFKCVCVGCGHVVCIHKALSVFTTPKSAQLFYTLVWLFCSETYLLSSPSSPDPMVSRYNSTNNSRTPPYYGHASSLQIPGLYTISKALTVLKWRMIMMLNRNCWKSRGYTTALVSMR